MEDEKITVPYIVYEGTQARQERTIKRLIVVIILLIVLFFGSQMAWLYAWNSYDYAVEDSGYDIQSDDGGNANFIGRDLNGELNNGENNGQDQTGDPD